MIGWLEKCDFIEQCKCHEVDMTVMISKRPASKQLFCAQKMRFSIKDLFSKCDESAGNCGFGHNYWRNL